MRRPPCSRPSTAAAPSRASSLHTGWGCSAPISTVASVPDRRWSTISRPSPTSPRSWPAAPAGSDPSAHRSRPAALLSPSPATFATKVWVRSAWAPRCGQVLDTISDGPVAPVKAVLSGVANPVLLGNELDVAVSHEAIRAARPRTGLGRVHRVRRAHRHGGRGRWRRPLPGNRVLRAVHPVKTDGAQLHTLLDRLARSSATAADFEVIEQRIRTVDYGARCNLGIQQATVLAEHPRPLPQRVRRPSRPPAPASAAGAHRRAARYTRTPRTPSSPGSLAVARSTGHWHRDKVDGGPVTELTAYGISVELPRGWGRADLPPFGWPASLCPPVPRLLRPALRRAPRSSDSRAQPTLSPI